MKNIDITLYEWKHFVRNPFKVVALLLFTTAGLYGLHNGASLYEKQRAEIEKINQKAAEQKEKAIGYYERGEKGPADRPWVDMNQPFWAIWNLPTYHFKMPSPALVYGVGQAEQYGFYKAITVWSSPSDTDMIEEIANPERLQTGRLDFAFVLLFLSPLLLLLCLYDIRSAEAEQGFLRLVEVQWPSIDSWLLSRMALYFGLALGANLILLVYGALLTDVFAKAGQAFGKMLLYTTLYLLFWTAVYFVLLRKAANISSSTLKMAAAWLLLAFIIPAAVHQWAGITKPASLTTDLIDVQRNGVEALMEQPDSMIDQYLEELFPAIQQSAAARDSVQSVTARSFSFSALANDLVKKALEPIAQENQARNALIRKTYWFNPITFFQNQLNAISQTHYNDFELYRQDIQKLIDQRIKVVVLDSWNGVVVNKEKYMEYGALLSQ